MSKTTESLPRAVALRYAQGDSAPVVVAKGHGFTADEIVRRARAAGLFVHSSPELVGLLMKVDLDTRIPPSLYLAVAELLAWIHRIEHDEGRRSEIEQHGR
ncbi:MAG TPA: EscU/YscU/HrcU family type III secretion system export apparatus switch protein [Casimicrobiaceae bacterium]|nr:EscU/YscU/HrcU family type III secretion system export apparatus switch protein [Casimicrobiaceae bacterium]